MTEEMGPSTKTLEMVYIFYSQYMYFCNLPLKMEVLKENESFLLLILYTNGFSTFCMILSHISFR